jgi:hypothetical protein
LKIRGDSREGGKEEGVRKKKIERVFVESFWDMMFNSFLVYMLVVLL